MPLTIEVRGFRGIERADIHVDGVALLTGCNHAGKSSICLGAAAAATGNPLPLEGVTKAEAGTLVHDGEPEGYVMFEDAGENQSTVRYPKAERETRGKPAEISAIAAGLASPIDGNLKSRTGAFAPYLKAEPTQKDLADAMDDAGVGGNDKLLESVWKAVTTNGWDAAHVHCRDTGARLKGRWEQITGERYGSDKAGKWSPEHWVDDTTEEALTEARDAAGTALEDTIARGAVDGAHRNRLEEDAAKFDEADEAVNAARGAMEKCQGEIVTARQARAALPNPDAKPVPCPHCGADIIVVPDLVGITLEKAGGKEVPKKEIKKVRDAIATADGAVRKAEADMVTVRRALAEAERAFQAASQAQDALDNAADGKSEDDAVATARGSLRLAEARLAAFEAKTTADAVHVTIDSNQKLVAVLAPDGLRRRILMRELEAFNTEHLAPLAEAAGWKPIVLTADFHVAYGGRRYVLLCNSEQWRCRAVLQAALARIEGAALVILDGADILDQAGRNGLMKVLRAAGVDALVAMTINRPEFVPDLEKAGFGASYWVEDGIARPLDEAMQEAA
jgi:hypothetical protein